MRTAEEILKGIKQDIAHEDEYLERSFPKSIKAKIESWHEIYDTDNSQSFTNQDIQECYFNEIVKPLYMLNFFHMLVFNRDYIRTYIKNFTVDFNITSAKYAFEILRFLPTDFRNTILSFVDNQAAFDHAVVENDCDAFTSLCFEHNHEIGDMLRICKLLQTDLEITTLMDYAYETGEEDSTKEALERHTQPIQSGLKRNNINSSVANDETVLLSQYFLYFCYESTYTTAEREKLQRLFDKGDKYYPSLQERYYYRGYIHFLVEAQQVDIESQITQWTEELGEQDLRVRYAKEFLEKVNPPQDESQHPAEATVKKSSGVGRKNGSWLRNIEDCPEESIGVKIEEIIWPDLKNELEKIHYGSIAGKSRETAIATLGASLLYYAYLEMKWAKDFNEAGVQISFWRTIKFLNVSRNNLKEYIKMMLAYDKIKALVEENGSVGFSVMEFCKNEGVDDIRAKLLTRNDGKNMAIINDIVKKLKTKLPLTLVDA